MRGKHYTLIQDPRFKIKYGSPMDRDVSSFYTLVSTWIEPEEVPTKRQLNDLRKRIKQAIYNNTSTDSLINKELIIVTDDIPEIGLNQNKKTYVDFEITCFLKQPEAITNPIFEDLAKDISGSTIEVLESLKGVNFYNSKK
jgi:hypothetical protein